MVHIVVLGVVLTVVCIVVQIVAHYEPQQIFKPLEYKAFSRP
ncbi:hypothetical protein [Anaerovibrio sp. RM50]|nr:hypothetical protein [Anaerovibrio sp. RM50]